MFNNLGQIADLMKNAGKIRESVTKASEALGEIEMEGISSHGAVTVRANGRLEILDVRIDPKIFETHDVALLEELITVASNQALLNARAAAAEKIKSLTGGLNIPGLGGLFGGGV